MFKNVKSIFNVSAKMRDGVCLAADVYLPTAGSQHPVVLARTPYNKNTDEAARLAIDYASNGFAFVWMDDRGRGDSEGIFVPYLSEARDGYDAIEWAAAQEWSEGRVATWGASYSAHIQWLTALEHPPSLGAMIVRVSPSDPFVEVPFGVFRPMRVCWHRLTDGRVQQSVDFIDWKEVYYHLPLADMDEVAGFRSEHWRADLEAPFAGDHWRARAYQDRMHEIDLPVLHISGWYDDEQIGSPLNFRLMRQRGVSERTRSAQHLLMGPWGHEVNRSRHIGAIDFGADSVIELEDYERHWLGRWLLGNSTQPGDQAPVRIFVMGRNLWQDETEWPPARAVPRLLYLGSAGHANSRFGDGSVSFDYLETHQIAEYDSFIHDPEQPVPFVTELVNIQIGGPDDYSVIEERADVLVYTSSELGEEIWAVGPVSAHLFVSSDGVDTDFMAKLIDVHPDGFCQRLADGMIRMSSRFGGDGSPSFIDEGRVYEITIDLWNTAHVFLPCHSIRVEIASSAFPKYDRNLNTRTPAWLATHPTKATNRLWHAGKYASAVVLSVLDDGRGWPPREEAK